MLSPLREGRDHPILEWHLPGRFDALALLGLQGDAGDRWRVAGISPNGCLVANRKTCVWCRVGVQREHFQFYSHSTLCPEHTSGSAIGCKGRLLVAAARNSGNPPVTEHGARLLSVLYRWLLESSLPVWLQVFWKLLTLSMAVILGFAAHTCTSVGAAVFVYALAVFFVPVCLFTKLGDG